MRILSFFFLALSLVDGVFGVNVTLTVMEGDSLTLKPQTVIPEDDTAEWWFGGEIIAEMNKVDQRFSTSEGDNVGFNGRLKLDHQTGSLTITNTRTNHTGLYTLKISGRNVTPDQIFSVTVRDVVKSLSVTEGDTVTLHTGVTDIQRDDQILWRFGDQDLNGSDARWSNTDLNDQTGDLTITNIRRNQFGDYEVENKNKNSLILHKKFRITDGYVEPVSVIEGDTVTLHTRVANILRDDQILWKFGGQVINTDRLNGADASWSNTVLNSQTGDLTIRNIRRNQSGDYEVNIKNKNSLILQRKFHINTLDMNIMSVMEGDSVTLQTDTKTQKDDLILWMYGPESTRIAEINRAVSEFSLYEDVLDGRFRGRLQLDHQTGSLTITNIRTTDTGVYKLQTSSSKATKYTRFDVAVSNSGLYPGAIAGIVVVLLVFAAAVAGVIYHRWRISKLKRRRDDAGNNGTNVSLKEEKKRTLRLTNSDDL